MDLRRGTERVLVVDDEAMVRDLARDILKRYGYAVEVASGGEEAVSLFREKRSTIAVVVLDILMPKVDGREAFHRIRALEPAAKVIVSSGFDQTQDADALLREGAVAFVQKPYRIAELVRAVGEAIEGTK